MQRDEDAHKECLVLLLEWQRESVNDGAQNLEKLCDPVMPLCFIDEMEEHVVDASPDGGSQIEEFPVYPMQRCLQEIAFTGILRVEKLKEVEHESLVDISLGEIRIEIGTLDEAQEEFVNDLEMRPGELKDGFVFFWVVSVACRVDRRGYGTEEVGGKLTQSHSECCAKGKRRRLTYHLDHLRVYIIRNHSTLCGNVFQHLM